MPVDTRSLFYTTETLSANRSYTPEGFLLICGVPICRTGEQMYGPGETKVPMGPNNRAVILREADQVFHPNTISSFNGKPFTNDHPAEGEVTLDNYVDLLKGIVIHPRRGEGVHSDMMLADVVVYDQDTIADILGGKVQVSAGYRAEEEVIETGRGRQVDIVANHVALVSEARCGERCSIGDSVYQSKETKVKKGNWLLKLIGGALKNDAKEVSDALEEKKKEDEAPDDEETAEEKAKRLKKEREEAEDKKDKKKDKKDDDDDDDEDDDKKKKDRKYTDSAIDSKFTAIEKKIDLKFDAVIAAIAEKATVVTAPKLDAATLDVEELDKTKNDSAYLDSTYQETVALAEIIAPGIRTFAFDAAAKPELTVTAVCDLRKRALTYALKDVATSDIITSIRGNRQLDAETLGKLTCDSARNLFIAVGNLKKKDNARFKPAIPASVTGLNGQTLAELNKRNNEFWNKGGF